MSAVSRRKAYAYAKYAQSVKLRGTIPQRLNLSAAELQLYAKLRSD